MKEYLKIIDEIIALVGLHLIPKFVNLYQGQVDIRCEENDTGVLINIGNYIPLCIKIYFLYIILYFFFVLIFHQPLL